MVSDTPWYEYWPEGVPKTVDIPENTLPEMLADATEGREDAEAIYTPSESYIYGEVLEAVGSVAGYLSQRIDPGDRVALYMHNRPEFVFALYGILQAGGVVVFIDPSTQEDDMTYELSTVDAEAVFFDEDVANDDHGRYKELGVHPIGLKTDDIETTFADVLEVETTARERDPGDDALIFYYAGVSEKSQPVYHTHENIVASERLVTAFKAIDKDDIGITTAPMTHGLGLFSTLQALHNGASTGLMQRFDEEAAIGFFEEREATYIEGGPGVYGQLLDADAFTESTAASLEWSLSAGAPLSEERHEAFVELTGAPLMSLYGLTEAPNVAMTPPSETRYGTMGIPLPNTDVKIVDPEDWSEERPIGEVGELLVDTPTSMRGYLSEEDTEAVFDGDWMATGDLVVMDEDGFLSFRGTRKRVINYKGYPILPRDLEEVLAPHDAVEDCRVEAEATDDEDIDQIPVATVVVTDPVDEDELEAYVNEKVSAYKQIRGLEIVDSLE